MGMKNSTMHWTGPGNDDDYEKLIDIYSELIRDWEPDQPLHYSGLATVQLFNGDIDGAADTLEYLDNNIEMQSKDAKKDRDLAYGYLYAERANRCFTGVDYEQGIEYRYPNHDEEVDCAEQWLEKAKQVPPRDEYLKGQIKTLSSIINAYRKQLKKRVFVGRKSVAFGGFVITVITLLYAFNVHSAASLSEEINMAMNIPDNTIAWIAKVIEQPGAAGSDVLGFFRGFAGNFDHYIQFFWPGILYLVSLILYIAVGSMPLSKAQAALHSKASADRARWREFKGALDTKNTYYRVTKTTRYSDGSSTRTTSTESDDAQGAAIRSTGCIHFFTYLFKVVFLPITALINLYRFRIK